MVYAAFHWGVEDEMIWVLNEEVCLLLCPYLHYYKCSVKRLLMPLASMLPCLPHTHRKWYLEVIASILFWMSCFCLHFRVASSFHSSVYCFVNLLENTPEHFIMVLVLTQQPP